MLVIAMMEDESLGDSEPSPVENGSGVSFPITKTSLINERSAEVIFRKKQMVVVRKRVEGSCR